MRESYTIPNDLQKQRERSYFSPILRKNLKKIKFCVEMPYFCIFKTSIYSKILFCCVVFCFFNILLSTALLDYSFCLHSENIFAQYVRSCPIGSMPIFTSTCGISKDDPPEYVQKKSTCTFNSFKSRNYGEDAAFVLETKNFIIYAIADGVGGWRNVGVDPSVFSKTILTNYEYQAREGYSFKIQDPIAALSLAFNDLLMVTDLVGSSTVSIANFDKNTRTLYTSNLGDSGFVIFRQDKIVHRSIPQSHSFNFPFQLSKNGKNYGIDKPEHSNSSEIQLKSGDIVLLASDGYFDNVYDYNLIKILTFMTKKIKINKFIQKKDKKKILNLVEATCSKLLKLAVKNAYNSEFNSPFGAEFKKRTGKLYSGGKVDDTTIILSIVG